MGNWKTLGEYYDRNALTEIESILHRHQIPFIVRTPETHLNSAFGQGTSEPFSIQVDARQFDTAQQLVLQTGGDVMVDEMSIDEYSTDELKAIVLNPADWHESFVDTARELLSKKGIDIEQQDVQRNESQKIAELEQGKEPSKVFFYFMWLFALVGGYIGIIAGFFYWRGKTQGFNGKRYYIYTQEYRDQGRTMFFAGLIFALFQTWLYVSS